MEKLLLRIFIFYYVNKDFFIMYLYLSFLLIFFIQISSLIDLRVMLFYSLIGFMIYIFFYMYTYYIESFIKKMSDFYLFFIRYFVKFENLLKIIILLNIFMRRFCFLVKDLFLFNLFFLNKFDNYTLNNRVIFFNYYNYTNNLLFLLYI